MTKYPIGNSRGFEIIQLSEVDSTNNEAIRILQNNGFNQKFVILTEKQTSGRGKQNAVWLSGEDNIAMTLTFLVEKLAKNFENFSIVIAEIINKIIENFKIENSDFECTIKFPNDLLINGKKAAGILPEMHFLNNQHFLIIGIGINWKTSPMQEFETVGKLLVISKEEFIDNIILRIDESINQIDESSRAASY